ncbi:MAG: hypothetical protein AAF202_00805 [Pseudomonadota bacterium]
MLGRLIILAMFTFVSGLAKGADNPFHDKQVKKKRQSWAQFYPYLPEKFDYYVELGSLWETRSQYWMGAGFGRHLGRCLLSSSQTCQQYWDVVGGFGGRDGLTTGLALTGVRWQFVNFPKVVSPSLSVLTGVYTVRDNDRDLVSFTYGLGYGITTSLHKRVDLRIEARAGMADEFWSQALFSFHLKLDKWVDYFGAKLKKYSIDAIGSGLQSTGGAVEGLFEGKAGSKGDSSKDEDGSQ